MPTSRKTDKEKEREKEKEVAAAAAAAKRHSKKKGLFKGFGLQIAIGLFGAVMLLALVLAVIDSSGKKKKADKGTTEVNDYYTIRDANAAAEENWTAAASSHFKSWVLADVKWGMKGVGVSDMVGMSGAVAACEGDDDMEKGVLLPSYDCRTEWPGCFEYEVSESKNCTSSYAIASASSLSARFCMADTELYKNLRLSPQQVLSCDKKSRGCKGGLIDGVWAYIQRRGLYPESCLPYQGLGGKDVPCKTECKEDQKLKAISHCVMGGNRKIKREIARNGPVVVPVRLRDDFLVYKGGVYFPTEASGWIYPPNGGEPIVHAVTLLGWGKDQGKKYWIIENSWGKDWGENGFARIAEGAGMLMEHYAVVGHPETEEALRKQKEEEEKAVERREQAKKDRAERDERIAQKKKEREEQMLKEQADTADEEDIDLDDLDAGDDEHAAEENAAEDEVDL